MPHRLPSPQRICGHREQRPNGRLPRTQEQNGEVEQQEAVAVAAGE